jgi:hypothetical protein
MDTTTDNTARPFADGLGSHATASNQPCVLKDFAGSTRIDVRKLRNMLVSLRRLTTRLLFSLHRTPTSGP